MLANSVKADAKWGNRHHIRTMLEWARKCRMLGLGLCLLCLTGCSMPVQFYLVNAGSSRETITLLLRGAHQVRRLPYTPEAPAVGPDFGANEHYWDSLDIVSNTIILPAQSTVYLGSPSSWGDTTYLRALVIRGDTIPFTETAPIQKKHKIMATTCWLILN